MKSDKERVALSFPARQSQDRQRVEPLEMGGGKVLSPSSRFAVISKNGGIPLKNNHLFK